MTYKMTNHAHKMRWSQPLDAGVSDFLNYLYKPHDDSSTSYTYARTGPDAIVV